MKLKIGSKHVLTNVAPYNPYSGHNNKKIPVFIEVEVIEEREGEGEFTGKVSEGYICKGSDGYLYGFNYPNVNEGYGNTCFHRWLPDEEFLALPHEEAEKFINEYHWQDVTHFQCPAAPKFMKNYPYLSYCDLHQQMYQKDESCFYCKYAKKYGPRVKMNMRNHAWFGWYDSLPLEEDDFEIDYHKEAIREDEKHNV